MRVARIAAPTGPRTAVWHDDRWHGICDIFSNHSDVDDMLIYTGETYGADVALLSPVEPRVILGMAHNSGKEGRSLPPQAFMKSARTAVGPGAPITIDPSVGTVVAEGELAVVIGRFSRNLTPEEVPHAVFGYTIGNDVTATEQIPLDDKMTQAKNGDGFTPLGPWIETDLDPSSCAITVTIAGRDVARSSTDELGHGVVELLVYLTSILTLGPGDIVLTGAPKTAAPINDGDHVEITIEGIGTLDNHVRHVSMHPGEQGVSV
jgi:2-keto-4-pentenoate hydratase/2-oxohepta-3-ene-1,7-dioic acid hydratase in catechol pathway